MKISFVRSGGTAGIRLATSVDSAALEPGHDVALRTLLARAPSSGAERSAVRDAFRYRLTIEDGDRTSELDLDEGEVPETVRPLLDWLTERARTRLRQA